MDYNLTLTTLTLTSNITLICFILKNHNVSKYSRKILIIFPCLITLGVIMQNFSLQKESSSLFIYSNRLYTLVLLLVALYLFRRFFLYSKLYQNTNKLELTLIVILGLLGFVPGALNLKFNVNWLAMSVASMFTYMYYIEINQSVDGLTGLLNQHCFINDLESLNTKAVLIILDVNDFKQINDMYGHQKGDEILQTVSSIIKKNYQDYGKVYRSGGDEFSVILTKNTKNFSNLNKKLVTEIQTLKKAQAELPYISYGSALYDPNFGDSKEAVLKKADDEMYTYKKLVKRNK